MLGLWCLGSRLLRHRGHSPYRTCCLPLGTIRETVDTSCLSRIFFFSLTLFYPLFSILSPIRGHSHFVFSRLSGKPEREVASALSAFSSSNTPEARSTRALTPAGKEKGENKEKKTLMLLISSEFLRSKNKTQVSISRWPHCSSIKERVSPSPPPVVLAPCRQHNHIIMK